MLGIVRYSAAEYWNSWHTLLGINRFFRWDETSFMRVHAPYNPLQTLKCFKYLIQWLYIFTVVPIEIYFCRPYNMWHLMFTREIEAGFPAAPICTQLNQRSINSFILYRLHVWFLFTFFTWWKGAHLKNFQLIIWLTLEIMLTNFDRNYWSYWPISELLKHKSSLA